MLIKIEKLSIYTQKNLPNRGVLEPPRRGVFSVKPRHKSFVRCHLNLAWLLQGGTCTQGYDGLISPGLPYLPFMARAEVSPTCLIFIN
jgi:hypothetical protein